MILICQMSLNNYSNLVSRILISLILKYVNEFEIIIIYTLIQNYN
jgi:hypothetical protein